MVKRSSGPRPGPRMRRRSLTPEQVREIRTKLRMRYAARKLAVELSPKQLAVDYGVSDQTIKKIARGETYNEPMYYQEVCSSGK